MLCLGKQVSRNMFRVAGPVVYHQNFAGAGYHIYPHLTEHKLFGSGHIYVARSGDLVHLRHSPGSVCQGSNSLCPADPEDPVNTGKPCRRQHSRVYLPSRSGADHDDFTNTGNPGRHGVHHNARRIAGLASWDIDPNAVKGGHLLPDQDVRLFSGYPCLGFLLFVKAGNTLNRQLKGSHIIRRQRCNGCVNLCCCQLKPGNIGQPQPVKPVGVFKQGCIPICANRIDDAANRFQHLRRGLFAAGEDGAEAGIKIMVVNINKQHGVLTSYFLRHNHLGAIAGVAAPFKRLNFLSKVNNVNS